MFSGFSLKWYERLFSDKEIMLALMNTFLVAVVASLLAAVIGTLAALGLNYLKKRQKNLFLHLNSTFMIVPEIIEAVSLMMFFVFLFKIVKFLKLGLLTLILSHTTICIPTVVLSVLPKLKNLDPDLELAAQDLGCTPIKAFFKVTLFNILPGIFFGILMSLTLSFDDFVISYFTGGTTQLLPIFIHSMTKKIVSPEINALSTLFLVFVLFLMFVINISKVFEFKSKKIVLRKEHNMQQ